MTNRKGITSKQVTVYLPVALHNLLSEFPNSVSRDLYYCTLIGLGINPNAPTSEIEEDLLKLKSKLDEFKELGMYPTLRDELITVPKEIRRKDEAMAEVYNDLEWVRVVTENKSLNGSGIDRFKKEVWKRKRVRVTFMEAGLFLTSRGT
ncbi:MAG: hypothetical protein PHT97_14050 [Methanoculleus sp.]|uniref:hypothetical protein n=1 Tax=Methanoculleus sp. TaxID=90427 RepID=UPI002627DEB9|nr:hypothetical protein [Methanoculleus sp.]MDD2259333.1 hypothetical protein [Bacilli bacterium]MDD4472265.1 hypothetical protein [Methanoculleus sp.]